MKRTRAVQLIVAALALLAVAWAVTPRSAPPLYDGVGFPDEPYRFVVAPSGAAPTEAPTTGRGSAAVSGSTAGAIHASSAEQAPQVSILIPIGRLHAPAGTSRVVIRATAMAPLHPPAGRFLWSNVYDIAATPGSVTLADAAPAATITLRAATAQRPYPTIERYAGTGWTKIETQPVGTDIYQATLPALGRYAVIGTKPIDVAQLKSGGAQKSTTWTGIIVAVIAVLVVTGLVLVGLRRRSRAKQAAGEPPGPDPPTKDDAT